jgi:hypothetical protein
LCRDIRADNYQGHFPELLKLAAYMQRPQLAAERLVVRWACAKNRTQVKRDIYG